MTIRQPCQPTPRRYDFSILKDYFVFCATYILICMYVCIYMYVGTCMRFTSSFHKITKLPCADSQDPRNQLYLALSYQGWLIILDTTYQKGKNIPNDHKMYQMDIKYTKWQSIIPNGHNIYQHFPIHSKALLNIPKFGFLSLKIYHLATLLKTKICQCENHIIQI
jgi:hypothetical protein